MNTLGGVPTGMEPCEREEGRSLRQVLHMRSASKGGNKRTKAGTGWHLTVALSYHSGEL